MADFFRSSDGEAEAPWTKRIFITQLNIEHYRQKLATGLAEESRQRIMSLLAEEEAKLAALTDPRGEKKDKKE